MNKIPIKKFKKKWKDTYKKDLKSKLQQDEVDMNSFFG